MFRWFRIVAVSGILSVAERPAGHGTLLSAGDFRDENATADRTFTVLMGNASFAHLAVEQHDVDIAAVIRDASGRERAVDAAGYGTESVSIIADPGARVDVRIRILTQHSQGAHYRIAFDESRSLRDSDRRARDAEQLGTAAKTALDAGGTALPGALAANGKATDQWRELSRPKLQAASLVQGGDILYARGDLAGAHARYLDALEIAERADDAAGAAEAANDAGYCELLLGEPVEAGAHVSGALGLWTHTASRYGRLTAVNNLGLIAWQSGDYAVARRRYREAAALADSIDRRSEGLLANNTGLVYLSLGDYDEAAAQLRRSLELLPAADVTARARTMINLGRAGLLSGDTATALGWLEKAATSARSSSDPRTLAQALNNLGQTLTAAGRPAEGEARLREALAIYSSAGDRKGAASALHHVGLARAGLGDFKGASSLLRQALRDRSDAGVRDDAADSLFGLARVARLQGRLSESARYCEQALDIVESLRGGVPGEHFRITWRAARDNFFEFYVDLLMEMHFARPAAGFDRRALEIAEYASGRSMLELLREGRSDIRGGVDPILLAREQDARSLTGYLAGRLSRLEERTHSPESRKLLETRYRDSMERGRAIEDEIRERSPAYSALIWPKPAHARDIRQGIGPGTVLLEYSVGEKASYLWQIDTESIRAIRLPGRSQLDPLCREVRQLSGDARGRRLHPETQGRYHDALTALSKTLLAPAAPQIANRKVLIVSRGMLQDVPFAALPLPGNPDEAPLGVTNEIVRMTSASAWLELRRENRPADSGRGIAVFADPVFDGEDPRVSRVLRTSAAESSEFARLPFSRKEGEEILGIFPGSSRLAALDFEASRSNLFRPETGSFRFLHFATHSVAGSSPELTGIALSNLTRDGRSVDGFVRLPDIYNLPRLSCRLVVLDGCDSGGGADARGEGLIGLMRGFLYAGSGSVLINLWPVEDGPRTADLMRDFYSAMERGGATPSAALRTARLNRWKLRDRWSDEYYLAGLEVYGADR